MTIKDGGAVKILDYYDPANTLKSATVATNRKSGLKYAKSGLNSIQMERYTKQLTELMITDKVYLEPGLTMPRLAELLNCSVNHLSQVLNSGFGMNFSISLMPIESNKRKFCYVRVVLRSKPYSMFLLL